MSYKNTMKLFVSNFTLAWKQLLYFLCCVFLFVLCSYTLISPIVKVIKETGVEQQINDFISSLYSSPKNFVFQLSEILKSIGMAIINNISRIYLNLIAALILCVIFPYILLEASVYNASSIIYQKLTMNMDVGYIQNGISKLGISIKFALTNLLLLLPFFAIRIVLLYFYFCFANTIGKVFVGLVILSTLYIFLSAIKQTLFAYYTGYCVSNQINPVSAYNKSLGITMKNFWRTMGSSVIIILTTILINGIIAIFTFFAGLIFTLPATFILVCIYRIVTYLNLNGNRYYLSNSVIFNPQKYVVKKDDYVSNFVPPEETKEIKTVKMKKYSKKTLKQKSK